MSARLTMRAVVGDEGDGQRHQRVAHPEAARRRLVVDEEHALVAAHLAAEHHARHLLRQRGGHFGLDQVHAGHRA
jgi:hypothetical protein